MMSFGDILLLSVALAMDCFTVSIVNGVILSRFSWRYILRLSVLFGVFQTMMPLAGWLGTTWMAEYIEAYDHWVAFAMLAFLGSRMIRDAFSGDDETEGRRKSMDPTRWQTGIVLAVATSIDALAVGISLAMTGYQTLRSLALPLVAIGLGSFLFSVLGHWLGIRFGAGIRRRLRPELLGGVILIAIGVKILITHLAENGSI